MPERSGIDQHELVLLDNVWNIDRLIHSPGRNIDIELESDRPCSRSLEKFMGAFLCDHTLTYILYRVFFFFPPQSCVLCCCELGLKFHPCADRLAGLQNVFPQLVRASPKEMQRCFSFFLSFLFFCFLTNG